MAVLPTDIRERSHHEATRRILRMLAKAILQQSERVVPDQDADQERDSAGRGAFGAASAVAATSLTEACQALRDALGIFEASLNAREGDAAGQPLIAAAQEHARKEHRHARALLRQAVSELRRSAAAEELAGWVEARVGAETAPVISGYLELEHTRERKHVERARRTARRAARLVLDTYESVTINLDAPYPDAFDRVLAGHLRHSLAQTSEALDVALSKKGKRRKVASKWTRRLSLLLGIAQSSALPDDVRDQASKALRSARTLTRALTPPVRAGAIEKVLSAAGLSELVDASLVAQLEPSAQDGALEALHADLLERVEQVADALDTLPTDIEIERKYLLSAMPPEALERGAVAQLEQGYLPGDRLRERVRRVQREGEVQYLRTIKLGRGVRRIELEEATTQDVFEALWALTKGCRVLKRRYAVDEGSLRWEVDAFDDRELFLAEVELSHVQQDAPLPAWLAPYVVREVTNEAEYVNLNLAR